MSLGSAHRRVCNSGFAHRAFIFKRTNAEGETFEDVWCEVFPLSSSLIFLLAAFGHESWQKVFFVLSFGTWRKTSSPSITRSGSGICATSVFSKKQPSKALGPMLVTPAGRVMEPKETQYSKALRPMLLSDWGMMIEVMALQLLNTSSPMRSYALRNLSGEEFF